MDKIVVDKKAKFDDSLKKSQPIVFCVECGSTFVDQNAIYALRCGDCGNEILWNGTKFSISRNSEFDDETSAFENVERRKQREKDWHGSLIAEIQAFSSYFIGLIFPMGEEGFAKSGREYEALVERWNQHKSEVDALLKTG
jgi:hypothetical protein